MNEEAKDAGRVMLLMQVGEMKTQHEGSRTGENEIDGVGNSP